MNTTNMKFAKITMELISQSVIIYKSLSKIIVIQEPEIHSSPTYMFRYAVAEHVICNYYNKRHSGLWVMGELLWLPDNAPVMSYARSALMTSWLSWLHHMAQAILMVFAVRKRRIFHLHNIYIYIFCFQQSTNN